MGRGSGGATSTSKFAKKLGFSVSTYRGATRLTRGGAYKVFKDNDSLTGFLGKVYNREVYLGKPRLRYGRTA